jgi:hypothetical protein
MLFSALMAAGAVSSASAKGIELTVYNANFALVKEVRTVELRTGRQELRVEDVAAQIDPTSVGFKSMTPGKRIEVLEQNYQYDLISPQAILNKSVGKRVRLREQLQNGNQVLTEGVLLSPPAQGMVIKTDDGRIVLSPTGTVEVLEVPAGLISRPTLMWDLLAESSGSHDIELAYLTNQIDWSADYVLTLAADDKKADLNGWVTINNRSGATYDNATLKLIAGDVRRIVGFQGGGFGGAAPRSGMDMKSSEGFREETLFEYHLYTLQRPATVRNNEQKQISLLTASDVDVSKELILEGQKSIWMGYGNQYRPGEGYASDPKIKVNVLVKIKNSEKNRLGVPLPKGRVRVYKRDASGQVQMLGEDSIDHTAREESVSLYIGDAFDVVGERKRTSFRRISGNIVEEDFEIKVRNRKKTVESIRVIEHAWSDWKILAESMKSTKLDSNTFEYLVTLKPDEERVITYTVQTRWF